MNTNRERVRQEAALHGWQRITLPAADAYVRSGVTIKVWWTECDTAPVAVRHGVERRDEKATPGIIQTRNWLQEEPK